MLNIDKIIDEHNDTVLEDKIVEELRKEFQSKLHEGEDTKVDNDYYRTIDNIDSAEGIISAVSTLPEDTFISVDTTTRICNIKENDQKRKIIFNKRELLEGLGLYELAATYPSDSTVELKVTVVGRDCDDLGHPIDFD